MSGNLPIRMQFCLLRWHVSHLWTVWSVILGTWFKITKRAWCTYRTIKFVKFYLCSFMYCCSHIIWRLLLLISRTGIKCFSIRLCVYTSHLCNVYMYMHHQRHYIEKYGVCGITNDRSSCLPVWVFGGYWSWSWWHLFAWRQLNLSKSRHLCLYSYWWHTNSYSYMY